MAVYYDTLKAFIEFINFTHIINSEDDYDSLFNYLKDFQQEQKNNGSILPDQINDSEIIEESSGINYKSCILDFDELMNVNVSEIDKKSKRRNSDLRKSTFNIRNMIVEEESEQFNTQENQPNTYDLQHTIKYLDEDNYLNAKKLLELLYNPHFIYADIVEDIEKRVYSLADIAMILQSHPYIKITCNELICIIAKVFQLNLNEDNVSNIKEITYNVSSHILEEIKIELEKFEKDKHNELNLNNQDDEFMKILEQLKRRSSYLNHPNTKEGNEINKRCEEVEEKINELIQEDVKFYSDLLLIS